ncbi:MAG: hypothetical protein QF561_06835 [Phycisphaerales bacterium]|nr:hypothetical protein [Phycisphaerales bacterium]
MRHIHIVCAIWAAALWQAAAWAGLNCYPYWQDQIVFLGNDWLDSRSVAVSLPWLAVGDPLSDEYGLDDVGRVTFYHYDYDLRQFNAVDSMLGRVDEGMGYGRVMEMSEGVATVLFQSNGSKIEVLSADGLQWDLQQTIEPLAEGGVFQSMALDPPWLVASETSGAEVLVRFFKWDSGLDQFDVANASLHVGLEGYLLTAIYGTQDTSTALIADPYLDRSVAILYCDSSDDTWYWTNIHAPDVSEYYGEKVVVSSQHVAICAAPSGDDPGYVEVFEKDNFLANGVPTPIHTMTLPESHSVFDMDLSYNWLLVSHFDPWADDLVGGQLTRMNLSTGVETEVVIPDSRFDSRTRSLDLDGSFFAAEGIEDSVNNRSVFYTPLVDCDSDGESDPCEIEDRFGLDANADGVLDACVCPGNMNPLVDALVDAEDVLILIQSGWGGGTGWGDFNGDNDTNVLDLLIVLENWGDCP